MDQSKKLRAKRLSNLKKTIGREIASRQKMEVLTEGQIRYLDQLEGYGKWKEEIEAQKPPNYYADNDPEYLKWKDTWDPTEKDQQRLREESGLRRYYKHYKKEKEKLDPVWYRGDIDKK